MDRKEGEEHVPFNLIEATKSMGDFLGEKLYTKVISFKEELEKDDLLRPISGGICLEAAIYLLSATMGVNILEGVKGADPKNTAQKSHHISGKIRELIFDILTKEGVSMLRIDRTIKGEEPPASPA
jgi:hypothetical protein